MIASGGDAQLRYAPTDRDHRMVARHAGSIPRGGSGPLNLFKGNDREGGTYARAQSARMEGRAAVPCLNLGME